MSHLESKSDGAADGRMGEKNGADGEIAGENVWQVNLFLTFDITAWGQNKGIFVSMPPQKHGEEQFTPEENELAYNISKLRVHIERDYSQTMSTLKNLPFYYLVTTLRCLIKV